MSARPVVAMTTDFGEQDHFVGVMKAVILKINPEAVLVDVNHQVSSYDIREGAFTLAQSYHYFPPETVHLVVVDPGVGSERRPILLRTRNYTFVAPDNGVLSFIYEREAKCEVRHVTDESYFLKPVSKTFHGRDIFAPVAAWLSTGVPPGAFGQVITDYVHTAGLRPQWKHRGLLQGVVIKLDKFGNLITNIRPEDVPELFTTTPPPFRMLINGREITNLYASFARGEAGEVFTIIGSSGYFEVVTNQGSAAEILQANRDTEVELVIGEPAAPVR